MSIMPAGLPRGERRRWARDAHAHLVKENAKWPLHLKDVPRDEWPDMPDGRLSRVWRSKFYMVQVYQEADGVVRLSIQRTAIRDDGEWVDGIAWDELQALKRQAGYGDRDAVEVYPPDIDVVNVANIRHLFVLPESLPFAWRRLK